MKDNRGGAGKEILREAEMGLEQKMYGIKRNWRPIRCGSCWKVQKKWGSEMCFGMVE